MYRSNAKFLTASPTITSESKNSWLVDKKPRIYHFYGVLETVTFLWRVLGIFPITLEGPIGMKKYEINKFFVCYGILLFAMCVANFSWGTYETYWIYAGNIVRIPSLTVTARALASLSSMMLTSVYRVMKIKKLTEVLEKMSRQGLILEQMGCRLYHERNVKLMCIYVWTTLGFISSILLYDLVISLLEYDIQWLHLSLWMFPLVVQVMNLTILVSLVGCLGLKFRAINDKTRIVVMRTNADSPKIIERLVIHAENLRALSKAHYETCAIGKRINNLFCWEMVINVIIAFIIIITTLYYIFEEILHEDKMRKDLIIKYIQWISVHSFPIITVVIICNWTSRQAMYTGKLIHQIRIEKMDSRLYEVVKSFSLQLHHQKIQFTASGLFPLNSTLLQMMLGNVTTYLIILIQFQPNLANLLE